MRFRTVAYFSTGALALWLLLSEMDGAGSRAVEPSSKPVPAREVMAEPGESPADLHRPAEGPEAGPLVGVLAAAETVELVAPETGRVSTVRVAPGDLVQRGELLAEIAPDDLDLQRQAQEARVREAGVAVERARLRADLDRRKVKRRESHPDLFSLEDREERELELESALLELEAAQARQAEAEAQLRLLRGRIARSRIVAPRNALVSERLVDPGGTVSPGQPLFQLVDASARIVRFAVPADRRQPLAVGMSVRVTPDLDGAGHESCATIARVSPRVEENAPLLFVEAQLPTGELAGVPLGTAVRVSVADRAKCHTLTKREAEHGAA